MAEVRLHVGKRVYKILTSDAALTRFQPENRYAENTVEVTTLLGPGAIRPTAQNDGHSVQGIPQSYSGFERQYGFCKCTYLESNVVAVADESVETQLDSSSKAIVDIIWNASGEVLGNECNLLHGLYSLGLHSSARIHQDTNKALRNRAPGPPLSATSQRKVNYWVRHKQRRFLSAMAWHGLCFGSSFSMSTRFNRVYNGGRLEEPLYKSKSAYYDILDVSPKANQTQIKTAYYKQSFIYHPDKNAGSEDATYRFAQISEAYNVLGNKSLRSKYDRGILSQADLNGAGRPPSKGTPGAAAGQQTTSRHSQILGTNQQSMLDFDKFIHAHYGEQLKRDKRLRLRRENMSKKKGESFQDSKLPGMTEVALAMLLAMSVFIFSVLEK